MKRLHCKEEWIQPGRRRSQEAPARDQRGTKEYKSNLKKERRSVLKMSGGKLANSVVSPVAKKLVITPGSVKSSELCSARPIVLSGSIVSIIPSKPSIVLHTAPNVASDASKGPAFLPEAFCISRDPDLPKSKASQKRPNDRKLTKPPRNPLSEDAMVLVEIEVHWRIPGASLHGVDEGRAPLPCLTSLFAFPEFVHDGFGDTYTEGTRNVSVQINLLAPFIHSNGFVPYTPYEGSFLLRSLSSLGILPVDVSIAKESTAPSGAAEIYRLIHSANPAPSRLGRILEQGGTAWPAIAVGIKI